MKNTTLLFLIKKNNNKISDICLAMKKRGFGAGRWNGVGGKLQEGETIEQALIREVQEEIGVLVQESDLKKVGELAFDFPHRPEFDQTVHVFVTETWDGEPVESEEMKPEWYPVQDVPYDIMWPSDKFWVPQVIKGELVRGPITFGENDVVVEHHVQSIEAF